MIDLRAERLNRGLSVRAAERKMGVGRNVLATAEKRETVPHPANARKIATFYGYKVTDVWPIEDPEAAAA